MYVCMYVCMQYELFEEERKQHRIDSIKDLYIPFEPFKFKKDQVRYPVLQNILREDYEFDPLYDRVVSPSATVAGLLSQKMDKQNSFAGPSTINSTIETATVSKGLDKKWGKKSLPKCVDALTESKKSKVSQRYVELFQDPVHKTGRWNLH